MKVYVASRFSDEGIARVRAMHDALRAGGHEVSYDWTRDSTDGKSGEDLRSYLEKCAERDLAAVRISEALIFIDVDNKTMRGAYVEFGGALALGRTVIVVGAEPGALDMPGSCIFFTLPFVHKVSTPDEAIAILDEKEKFYERCRQAGAVHPGKNTASTKTV